MDMIRLVGALRNGLYLALILITAWALAPEATQQVVEGFALLAVAVAGVMGISWIFFRLGPTYRQEDFASYLSKFWRTS